MTDFELKTVRVYGMAPDIAGYRVLVDRLWPRGVRKETMRLDRWAKEVTPSPALRQWFGHQAERFPQFEAAYRAELDSNPAAAVFADELAGILKTRDVLLLYGAKSSTCNHAVILRDWLLEQMSEGSSG